MTSETVAYGTPEMACEIMGLFKETDVQSRKILVMAGHEGGIVAFGKNLQNAFDVLMCARELAQPCAVAGNMPATAGRMPALPDMTSACMTGLALTAICVDVRCARKCMTVLRIGTKRQALRAADFLESVWPVGLRFWRANPM